MPFNPPLSPAELAALLGRYGNVQHIGVGGQGQVYRGMASTGLAVAIKVYDGTVAEERPAREVEALRAISCPTLVRVHDAWAGTVRSTDVRIVATEFVAGMPLDQRLRSGALTAEETATIGRDVAQAIEALWNPRRIVHRDVKPSNIMVTPDGRGILIDLGLARHTLLSTLSSAGTVWGTEGYFAPEQLRIRRGLTCRADVFALGVVLQQCLLGRHPTGGQQQPLLMGGPRTLALAPAAPRPLAILIDRMVAANPVDRPMPAQIRLALDSWLSTSRPS